jgi:selenide,water dikinase
VGLQWGDDAAVYRLDAARALIATVDFFPPIVDDPYTYGAVAAANSMSDVYAMGGQVLFALNVTAFPDTLSRDILTEILQGGADKVAEAGGIIAGGHTVTDREPKYGLCVIGVAHPDSLMTKAAAKPGDILVLTKPLGTGAITTALKARTVEPAHLEAAIQSMLALNKRSSEILTELGVRACTDITGYGLLGHALEMADASGAALEIEVDRVPLLDGAYSYAERGILPGGAWRNRDHLLPPGGEPRLYYPPTLPEAMLHLLYDPETSGGLLAAVPESILSELETRFRAEGLPLWIVGRVVQGRGILLRY